jgi:hypothetical protein
MTGLHRGVVMAAVLTSGMYDGDPGPNFGTDPAALAQRSVWNGIHAVRTPLFVSRTELDPPAFVDQAERLRDMLCKAGVHGQKEAELPFISITRLRIRSLRFLPAFALQTLAAIRQVRRAPGFQGGALLPDRRWTFWTMTVWDSEASMRAYMISGDHRTAMPRLLEWGDEASVVHWEQTETAHPSWAEAELRMRASGRPSKVRHPSPEHASLGFQAPRLKGGTTIRPT